MTAERIAVELSVVIPVYGSEKTLPLLAQRLRSVLEGMGLVYEIVFVDDGSPDRAWEVLTEIQSAHPEKVTAIQLMRNFGQHNALMCGLRQARGKYVLTMDDDLQNPPEEIPKLLAAIRNGGFDLVYGCSQAKHDNGWRKIGSYVVNVFYRHVFKLPVTVSSFRIIRRELLNSVLDCGLNFTFLDGLFAWNTERISEVAVDHQPRVAGRSGYGLRKLVGLALSLFTNFSILPLQLSFVCGLCAALAGFLMGIYYLVQYCLSNIVVPGYASIIISILVMGGAQLLALGVIGQYLGRMHLNVNRKPQYAVRQTLADVRDHPDSQVGRSVASSTAEPNPANGHLAPNSAPRDRDGATF